MKQRDIKFRVWDNVDYMSEPFTLQGLVMGEIKFTPECKVMQFTGLKDKNGVEIYEGDVVETFGSKFVDENWVEVRHISVIEWWQSSSRLGYRLKNSKGKTMMIKPYALTNTMKAKVIGNIHEHSNLLK